NVPEWNIINERHQTPDISPVIQEIINRNNWASGNALSILVTGSGKRTAESYDIDRANAPFLVVEYRTDGPLAKYILPDPVSLQNTTGNFWVNYTWQAGAGNLKDSYNININGIWTNGTTLTYSNDTVGPHGTSTIIVYAYNTSAGGTISSDGLTDSVTIPNNPITINNTSDASVNEGMTVYVDYDFTDADSDTPTFSCNRTELFNDFNTDTGTGTWSTGFTDPGTYSVDFGVSDGQGSTDNYTMTITVTGTDTGVSQTFTPPDPVSLQNTTGDLWVNYTWQAGAGNVTDSYNISINGTWTNGTTLTNSNDTVGPHGTSTIIVYTYNTSTGGTLSSGSLTDSVTIPNNPITINNTSDASVNEGMTVYVDYDFTDANLAGSTSMVSKTNFTSRSPDFTSAILIFSSFSMTSISESCSFDFFSFHSRYL
ncbi:MAG: hypothetical protein K8S14_07785, partial [Actinomycetia bacterium]|nr:hypothetical protein [Actinomycetes bacterium]